MIDPHRPSRLPQEEARRNGKHQPEEIRQEMQRLRAKIHQDAHDTAEDAQRLVDWKGHVVSHPFVAVGAAALAGFFLVPSARRVVELTDKQVERLARKGKLNVQSDQTTAASAGAMSSVLLTIGAFAGRALVGQVVERLETMYRNHQTDQTTTPKTRHEPSND